MDSIVGALREMWVAKMKNINYSLAFFAQNLPRLLVMLFTKEKGHSYP